MMKFLVKMIVSIIDLVLFSLKTIETEPKTLLHFEECRLCSSASHPLTFDAIDAAMYPEYRPYVTLGKVCSSRVKFMHTEAHMGATTVMFL